MMRSEVIALLPFRNPFQAIDKEIKVHIEKETALALESTEPDLSELGSDVYKTDVPLIMRSPNKFKSIVNLPNM